MASTSLRSAPASTLSRRTSSISPPVADTAFVMSTVLKFHYLLISLHVDGHTKQSVLEVAAELHSLAGAETAMAHDDATNELS